MAELVGSDERGGSRGWGEQGNLKDTAFEEQAPPTSLKQ